ncbi:hypothetical protein SOVF_136290 [Spinacia oleracea]|nr:hypothetical protein SOVF_136290 [Spinacia oleracea]
MKDTSGKWNLRWSEAAFWYLLLFSEFGRNLLTLPTGKFSAIAMRETCVFDIVEILYGRYPSGNGAP